MKQAYGYQSWLGFGAESAWGEAAARTHYTGMLSDSMKAVREKVFSESFRGRNRERWMRGREGASGSLGLEAAFEGMEPLWRQVFGAVESEFLTDGGAGHWRHALALADDPDSSLTLEVQRGAWDPELAGGAGAPSSFLYTGCRADEITFSLEPDSPLKLDVGFIARNESLTEASVPSFGPERLMDFGMAALEIDGEAREAQSLELRLKHNLTGDRRALGRREILPPIPGGRREITGSIKLFFDRLDDARRFSEGREGAVKLTLTGPPISEGGAPFLFALHCPRVLFHGQTPLVDAAGPLSLTLDFEALSPAPGEGPLAAELRNSVEAL